MCLGQQPSQLPAQPPYVPCAENTQASDEAAAVKFSSGIPRASLGAGSSRVDPQTHSSHVEVLPATKDSQCDDEDAWKEGEQGKGDGGRVRFKIQRQVSY